jgi:hypothetical protein
MQDWGQDGLRRRRQVVETAVRPDRVVLSPPVLDDDLGLLQRKEQLPIQQLISELCSDTPRFRQISPTFIPCAKATSASRSIPMIFSVVTAPDSCPPPGFGRRLCQISLSETAFVHKKQKRLTILQK